MERIYCVLHGLVDDVSASFASAHAFCAVPLESERLGFDVLESMAVGIPW